MQLHHVRISMPRGGEYLARAFYRDAVGLQEIPKPPALAGRGGCWFRYVDGDVVTAEVHLGVDDTFVPANKAHVALLNGSIEALEALGRRIEGASPHQDGI